MKKTRNSAIEILRIVSMFFIIMHHACISNSQAIFKEPLSTNSFFAVLWGGWGALGAALFFVISAWYMLDEEYIFSIRSLFKVILETIIFAIIAVVITGILGIQYIGVKTIIKSILSPILNTYWFATVYILLYLLLPFIRKCMNMLSDKELYVLVVLLTIFIPLFRSGISMAPIGSLDLAIYIAVLVAWVKRKKEWFSKCANKGLAFNVILIIGGYLASKLFGLENYAYEILINRYSVFSIFGAIFLFFLFEKKQFRSNRVVNLCAKSMFGIFILHSCPDIALWLWDELFLIHTYYDTKLFPVYIPICGICVLVVCMLISLIVNYILRFIKIKGKIVEKIDSYLNIV